MLKGSTSSLCNNLAILVMPDKRQISYAVVHKYAVNVIAAATDGSSVTARQVICKEPSATQGNPFLMEACVLSFFLIALLDVIYQRINRSTYVIPPELLQLN